MIRVFLFAGLFLLSGQGLLLGQEKILFTVTGGKTDSKNVPVCVPLSLSAQSAKEDCPVVGPANPSGVEKGNFKGVIFAQLTSPGLMTEKIKVTRPDLVRRDLHFVLPELKAGQQLILQADFSMGVKPGDVYFRWVDKPGEYAELLVGDTSFKEIRTPVLRYMHKPYDDSTPENRNKTYKVFHHLYDPSGKRFVTNGGHTNENASDLKKLLYPHHRGLQMGFNKTMYAEGKKKADTWHCQKDDHQSHEGFLNVEAGSILGRHRVAIDWHGEKKEVIVKEEREFTVYNVPGGTLVEFASRLRPAKGKVKLDGDPQHAGFQFRAHNDVAAKTAKQTYYLRPDGKGKPGETRNWPQTKTHVNLPWNAMSFVLDDKRYTVCYLDHPNNPRESRHSERDYGRFGCYFEHELTEDRPLLLNYRVWLQDGEMTGDKVQALSDMFTAPPKVVVK